MKWKIERMVEEILENREVDNGFNNFPQPQPITLTRAAIDLAIYALSQYHRNFIYSEKMIRKSFGEDNEIRHVIMINDFEARKYVMTFSIGSSFDHYVLSYPMIYEVENGNAGRGDTKNK